MDIEQRVNDVATKTAVLEATIGAKLDGIAADTTEIKSHLKELNGRTRKAEDKILLLEQGSVSMTNKQKAVVAGGAGAGVVMLVEIWHVLEPHLQQWLATQ